MLRQAMQARTKREDTEYQASSEALKEIQVKQRQQGRRSGIRAGAIAGAFARYMDPMPSEMMYSTYHPLSSRQSCFALPSIMTV